MHSLFVGKSCGLFEKLLSTLINNNTCYLFFNQTLTLYPNGRDVFNLRPGPIFQIFNYHGSLNLIPSPKLYKVNWINIKTNSVKWIPLNANFLLCTLVRRKKHNMRL